jgi:hypothetical protein
MSNWFSSMRAAWMAAGIVIGFILGGLLPDSPLHATATDRADNFALATGTIEEGIEAIFTLDFLTGDLNAYVLNPTTRNFSSMYHRNLLADFKIEGKAPKFLMVTGMADLRGGGQSQFSESVVYVAELSSGLLGVYAVPFNPGSINRVNPQKQPLIPLTMLPFRTTAVRQ